MLDRFRERPIETIVSTLSPDGEAGSLGDVPAAVRVMAWMFVESPHAERFKSVAAKVLGAR